MGFHIKKTAFPTILMSLKPNIFVMLMILMFTKEVNLLGVTGRSKITAKETIEMTTSVNDYDVYKTFYE